MDNRKQIFLMLNILIIIFSVFCVYGADNTAEVKYPGLFNSALRLTVPSSMPSGELLSSGKLKITKAQLDAEIKKSSASLQEQFKKNEFFVLEQMAISQLLMSEAKTWAESKKIDIKGSNDNEITNKYLTDLTSNVTVSAEEAKQFYESNPEMFGGIKFLEIQSQLKDYLLKNKKQSFAEEHINNVGKRVTIKINDAWAKIQYAKAIDNPVAKALRSGKPSFVNFGADGCVPCDMMAPIREEIKKEYAGKLNVVFINVREDQIMGARYGVSSIPIQVFYDNNGKEVYRHTGFWAKDKLVEKIGELGVKK